MVNKRIDYFCAWLKNLVPVKKCFLAFAMLLNLGLTAQTARISLNPSLKPFYHGVESGDPMPDKMIIWTKVTPDTGLLGDIDVYWQIATDTSFDNIVNYGKLVATEANHYTVKTDVCGLQPSTFYYYMFQALGRNSIIGRTKTAPDNLADSDSIRFAVASCSSWEHGYFNAYQRISERNDIDAVVHLGDYIYEYATGDYSSNINGREYDPPTECLDEIGYELRYSQYKLDDQLRRIHQIYPFITVWDDHETANDAWKGGAQNHTPGTEGNYFDRKNDATNTYFKWMPIRKPDPNDAIRIFRTLRYGKLLDLIMLDTRLYDRDEQDLGSTNNANHQLMGPVQRAWFLQQLSDTTTRWKIIGNQVMFAPLQVFGAAVNADQWDGYNFERNIIQNHIINNNINDVVILTGDIHTSWCNDVPGPNYNANTGAGSVCVEFVASSITSSNSPLPVGQNIIKSLNPHMKYINLTDKGYYILDVKKNRVQADYRFVSTVTQLGGTEDPGPSYFVNHLQRNLTAGTAITNAPKIPAPLPPFLPKQNIGMYKIVSHVVYTPENTQVVQNVIPSLQLCPLVTMTVFAPSKGTAISLDGQNVTYVPNLNYYGNDTVVIQVCTNEQVPVCDTVYFFVTVESIQTKDTITVNLTSDSTHAACLAFDDLSTAPASFNVSTASLGTLTWNAPCFTYKPNSSLIGVEVLDFIACDSLGQCDTVVYVFNINNPTFAETIVINLLKNTNVTYCPFFDDLFAKPTLVNVIKAPTNGTYQWVDTCLKYFPFFNYIGNDTMVLVACDNGPIVHCDTIVLVYQVGTTKVEQPEQMVVFGVYPNPVGSYMIVQYYLYEPGEVQFNLYNCIGQLMQTSKQDSGTNLQYVQLKTENIAAGNYVLEIKSKGQTFHRKIVKK